MVIVEDGADEIMQTFMSGQEKAYEGFLLVDESGNNVEETPASFPAYNHTGNNNSDRPMSSELNWIKIIFQFTIQLKFNN